MTLTIVFGNAKGGTGKSTLAMHVAVALLNAGLSVATVDLDATEKKMREATVADPANPAYWNELGITLRMRGQFDAAADAYEHSIAADPMFAPAHRNYAVLLDLYRNDPVHALAEMQRYATAVASEEGTADYLRGLGETAVTR